jgi:PAS domain-containing protein
LENYAIVRISLGLVAMTCAILILMDMTGLVPAAHEGVAKTRAVLCESLAHGASEAAARNDYTPVKKLRQGAVRRNDDVLSIGLRDSDGRILVATSEHHLRWSPTDPTRSTLSHVRVAIGARQLEVRMSEVVPPTVLARLWARPVLRLLVVLSGAGFVGYMLYMRRTLRLLDPSAVIPPRVQAAFDVMSEGVLLLDRTERIVLANSSFAQRVGSTSKELLGLLASEFDWRVPGSGERPSEMPWEKVVRDSTPEMAAPLSIEISPGELRTFMVNAAPVGDEGDKVRGAIVTFDDITALEKKSAELEEALMVGEVKSAELEETLQLLSKSRDEIRLQNDELSVLARCDPLTGISNRRSFMEKAELEFEAAQREGQELSVIMTDIDHFKLVNDTYGHIAGDAVLRAVVQRVLSVMRPYDTFGRFGARSSSCSCPDQ